MSNITEEYLQGYEAALFVAESCTLKVSSEIDGAIKLGIQSVVSALKINHKRLKDIKGDEL